MKENDKIKNKEIKVMKFLIEGVLFDDKKIKNIENKDNIMKMMDILSIEKIKLEKLVFWKEKFVIHSIIIVVDKIIIKLRFVIIIKIIKGKIIFIKN